MWIYNTYELHPWISILGGTLLCALLLFIYFTYAYGKFTGKIGSFKGIKRRFGFATVLVFGFALQGLMYISAKNIKNPEIKGEFLELHPILRLSVSTLLILDRKAILTDAQRLPEDYKKMGLDTNSRSQHYSQKDGYVHAVDLRTNGRSVIRNTLLKMFFDLMGFQTLRHVGTADHLHIAMKR